MDSNGRERHNGDDPPAPRSDRPDRRREPSERQPAKALAATVLKVRAGRNPTLPRPPRTPSPSPRSSKPDFGSVQRDEVGPDAARLHPGREPSGYPPALADREDPIAEIFKEVAAASAIQTPDPDPLTIIQTFLDTFHEPEHADIDKKNPRNKSFRFPAVPDELKTILASFSKAAHLEIKILAQILARLLEIAKSEKMVLTVQKTAGTIEVNLYAHATAEETETTVSRHTVAAAADDIDATDDAPTPTAFPALDADTLFLVHLQNTLTKDL